MSTHRLRKSTLREYPYPDRRVPPTRCGERVLLVEGPALQAALKRMEGRGATVTRHWEGASTGFGGFDAVGYKPVA
jgi:hypothetical protein